jgi:hypothetical protein
VSSKTGVPVVESMTFLREDCGEFVFAAKNQKRKNNVKGKVKGNGQECPFHTCPVKINVNIKGVVS